MSVFKNILLFLTSFFFAFFIWGSVEYFLPKSPVIFIPPKNFNKFYYFNLTNKFFTSNAQIQNENLKTLTLNGVKLKAVYNDGKKAFVIVEKNNKTYFVNLGEKFNGYKLVKVLNNSAVFEKNGKFYKINFEKIKTYAQTTPDNSPVIIKRDVFEYYKKNLAKIWQNIGIIKTPEGYKITYIKPGSVFQKLGLKKGDIILEVNDIKLKTDADAWKAYNSIQNYPEVEITVKRNFNIKVLRYELE